MKVLTLLLLSFFVSVNVSVAVVSSSEEKVPAVKDWYHYDTDVVKVPLPRRMKVQDGSKCEVLVKEMLLGFKEPRTLARFPITATEREQGFAYVRRNPKWFRQEKPIHVSLTLFQKGGLALSSKPVRVKRVHFYWHLNPNLFEIYKPHVEAHHVYSIEDVRIKHLHNNELLLLLDFRTNTIDEFVGHVYEVEIQGKRDEQPSEVHRRSIYGTDIAVVDFVESLSNFDNIISNFDAGDHVKVRIRMVMPLGGYDDIFGNWSDYVACTIID